jgi:O-antigen/teichoic acid export membrane protein
MQNDDVPEKKRGKGLVETFVRGASSAFVLNVSARGLNFIVQIVLARWLTVGGYGIYALVVASVSMLVILGKLGLDTVVLRYVAALYTERAWARLRGVLTGSNRIALGSSLLILGAGEVVLYFFGDGMEPVLRRSWQIGLFLVPLLVMTRLRQEALRALHRIVAARFPENILVPVSMLGILFFFHVGGKVGPEYALIARLTAVGGAFAIGSWLLLRALPKGIKKASPEYHVRTLFLESLPYLLVASMQVVMGKIDVVMLGYYMNVSQVGLYNAAVQLTTVAAFGLIAANTIAAPMISSYYAQGNHSALQKTVSLTALGAAVFSLLVLTGFLFFGRFALRLFGETYLASWGALWILLAARMGSAFAGPVGWILAMTGRQKFLSKVLIIFALADVMLNALLIPIWGIKGAALATMIVTILSNGVMGYYVFRKLKVNPTCFSPVVFHGLTSQLARFRT